jgi:hypothetical protein
MSQDVNQEGIRKGQSLHSCCFAGKQPDPADLMYNAPGGAGLKWHDQYASIVY